jgi:hypothetical protein
MPPLIVQFLLMRGANHDVAQQGATRGFATCMAALGELGHTYWHAQFYHDFFQLAAAAGWPSHGRALDRKRRKDAMPSKARKANKAGQAGETKRTKIVSGPAAIAPTVVDTTDTTDTTETISPLHSDVLEHDLVQALDPTMSVPIAPPLLQPALATATLFPLFLDGEETMDTELAWPAGTEIGHLAVDSGMGNQSGFVKIGELERLDSGDLQVWGSFPRLPLLCVSPFPFPLLVAEYFCFRF